MYTYLYLLSPSNFLSKFYSQYRDCWKELINRIKIKPDTVKIGDIKIVVHHMCRVVNVLDIRAQAHMYSPSPTHLCKAHGFAQKMPFSFTNKTAPNLRVMVMV